MAGVAVGTIIGVGLVHGLVHHSCHPDSQVCGEGEHETTPIWEGGAERPVRGWPGCPREMESWGTILGDDVGKQESRVHREAEFGRNI